MNRFGLRLGILALVLILQAGTLPTPAAAAAPATPSSVSPGSSSEFGPTISTLTPTLQWSAASGATNYHVAVRKYAGSWDAGPIVVDKGWIYGTSYTVPSGALEPGQRYRWNVQAYNDASQGSGWSSRLYFQTQASASAPDAPTGLTVTSTSQSEVNLQWSPPSSNGGSSLTHYRIYRGTSSGAESFYLEIGADWTTFRNTGSNVDCGTTYYYKVTAVNGAGEGPRSNGVGGTTSACPPSATYPSAPRYLSAAGGDGQNGLAWSAPSDDGGATITNYKVFRGTSSGSEYIVTSGGCANLGNVQSCTDTGLQNGKTYYYWVSAVNSVGQGAHSNEATATPTQTQTTNDPPSCSIDSPSQSVTVQTGQQQTFTATCTDPEGRWRGNAWNLDSNPDGGSDAPPSATRWTTSRTHSWSEPGTHSLGMGAVDDDGQSSNLVIWSITVIRPDQPPPPPNEPPTCKIDSPTQSVTVQVGESTTFMATCTDPEGAWQGTAWSLDGSPDGPSDTPPASSPSWTTSRTHSWQSPGTHYLSMAALDDAGKNSGAVTWTITVTAESEPPANSPDPPTGSLTLTNEPPDCVDGYPGVLLKWNAASGTNVVYDLYRDGSLNSARSGISGTEFYNGHRGGGLDAGATYVYKVTARNSGGSIDSNTLSVRIPGDICTPTSSPSPTPQPQYPDPTDPPTELPQPPPGPQEADPMHDLTPETQQSGTGYFFIHGICSSGYMWTEFGHLIGIARTTAPANRDDIWGLLTDTGRLPYLAPTYGGQSNEGPLAMKTYLAGQLKDFMDGKTGYEGWQTATFANSNLGLPSSGVVPAKLDHPLSKVVIVGHSNGGLMARWLLYDLTQTNPEYADRIERVVTLDSPDLGLDHSGLEYLALKWPGGCPTPWVEWTKTYLQTTNPKSDWISTYVRPESVTQTLTRSQLDSEKVIRFIYGHCPNLEDRKPTAGTCENGNRAVMDDMADSNGAIILGQAGIYTYGLGSGGLDVGAPGGLTITANAAPPLSAEFVAQAAASGCRESAAAGTGFAAVGIRHGVGYTFPAHVSGTTYFAPSIIATARDGLSGFYKPHNDDTTTFECSIFNKLHEVSTVQVAGVVTLSTATQSESLAASGGAQSRKPPTVQTQAYETGFTMTAEPSDNKFSLLRIKVSSPTSDGKIVVVNANSALWAVVDSRIGVWLDNQPVQQADDYADLTSDTSATSTAKYLLVKGAVGHQFLVWVPHFSERTIEIAAIEEAGQAFVTPLGVAAMAAGAIMIAAVAYGLGRRQSRSKPQSAKSIQAPGEQQSLPSPEGNHKAQPAGSMPRTRLAWAFILSAPAIAYGVVVTNLRFTVSPVEEDIRAWVATQFHRAGDYETLAVGVAVAIPLYLFFTHLAAVRRWELRRISEAIEAEIQPEPGLLPGESDEVLDFGGQLEHRTHDAPRLESGDEVQVPAEVEVASMQRPAEPHPDGRQAPLDEESESGEGDALDPEEDTTDSKGEEGLEVFAAEGPDGAWLSVEGTDSDGEKPSAGGWESVDGDDASHQEAVDEDGWGIVLDETPNKPSGGSRR